MTAPDTVRAAAPALPAPALPAARGPLSAAALALLTGAAAAPPGAGWDPYGEDAQLALYVLYEPHYRGFAGVPDEREWDAGALELRAALEARFLGALRRDAATGRDARAAFDALLTVPASTEGSVAHHLATAGERWQLREYAALRSLYHLKEADPHAWVLPRLSGAAKAAMAAIEYDEFGAGRPEDAHSRLFAELMTDLGLDTAYGRYLDHAPAEALATVNVMSLFGLHRALRGALVGHFGWLETTSSPASRTMAEAMRRLGAGAAAERFYTEHVEADAVHEQVVRREVVGGLLAAEPHLAPDIAFGVDATEFLENRLSALLLTRWRAGRPALRRPLDR
jgi:hypothetical protein